tara:strand:- start:39 stop:248 length:210 start_codon:yes stop_codon:yes gene_type:complete
MNIEHNGISYFIEQKEMENKNSLIERSWYIVNNYPKNEDEYIKTVKKSHIFTNINQLGCKYNSKLENKL